MAELEMIAETLRRQRRDLEDLMDSTASRCDEAADLVDRIQDLQRRVEATQRRFEAALRESNSTT